MTSATSIEPLTADRDGPDDRTEYESRWARLMAPRTGCVLDELLLEASEFYGIPVAEARARAEHAAEEFAAEWRRKGVDGSDADEIIRFYNESQTEVFDLIAWHAGDPIHHRTFTCADLARGRGGRTLLDYGSGIGSDAIVFAESGFEVTLADVSDPLLAFAAWRCRRRGLPIAVVDLKTTTPAANAFDAAICFDVLEHVPDPVATTRAIRRSLRDAGLLFLHAPFGRDPLRPMHITERDVLSPRMRALGFQLEEHAFPSYVWAPRVYRRIDVSLLDRIGYYVSDVCLPQSIAAPLGAMYRRIRPQGNPRLHRQG